MKRCIEEHTPYDQSVLYELNELYWRHRGVDAWTSGEVPYGATSNYPLACQHARFLIALVAQLEAEGKLGPADPVKVMEVGGGLGEFAANILSALEKGCGEAGQRLLKRLRYRYTDFAASLVAEAAQTPQLAPWIERGVLSVARFDLREPEVLEDLSGEPLSGAAVMVICNYVCCVAGCKHLQRRSDGWYELNVKLMMNFTKAEDPGDLSKPEMLAHLSGMKHGEMQERLQIIHRWSRKDVDEIAGPEHARVVETATRGMSLAAFAYPVAFMEFMRRVGGVLVPGGVALVNDYGYSRRVQLRSLGSLAPRFYGGAISHEVNFSLFDALAEREGWGIQRTMDQVRSLHHVAVRRDADMGVALDAAFQAAYIDCEDGEELIALSSAAQWCRKGEKPTIAARLYRKCIALEPENPHWRLQTARVCLAAGCYVEGLEHLDGVSELAGADLGEVAELMGYAYRALTEEEKAIQWYRVAVEHDPSAANLTALAELLIRVKEKTEAVEVLERALNVSSEPSKIQAMITQLTQ